MIRLIMEKIMENLADSVVSKNNLEYLESLMGIEISDDELLNMDPELLLKIQAYLKEYRDRKRSEEPLIVNTEEANITLADTDHELTVLKTWEIEEAEALFEEVETKQGKFLGIRITQDGRTYIARKWKLTDELKDILSKSVSVGYTKFWRYGQPQDSYFFGEANYFKGSHHISCSSGHSDPWIFALGATCLQIKGGKQFVKEITFNKHLETHVGTALENEEGYGYAEQGGPIQRSKYRHENFGGKNITTHTKDFDLIITYIANEQSN